MKYFILTHLMFFIILFCLNYLQGQSNSLQIAFVSEQQNRQYLIAMNLGGSELDTLFQFQTSELVDESLRSSPKGPYMAMLFRKVKDWFHGTSTHTSLKCLDLSTKTMINITNWNPWDNVSYSWYPEEPLLFYISAERNNKGIFSFDVSTQETKQIIDSTSDGQFSSSNSCVRISYSGNKLAYMDGKNLFIANIDGGSKFEIPVNTDFFNLLEWAPGDSILFYANYIGIFKYGLKGKKSIEFPANTNGFSVSPIGNLITFVEIESDSTSSIYSIEPNGKNLKILTSSGANISPVWSPDGQKIAFTSNRDGNWEIYVMNYDGTEQKRLTHNIVTDHSPAWIISK